MDRQVDTGERELNLEEIGPKHKQDGGLRRRINKKFIASYRSNGKQGRQQQQEDSQRQQWQPELQRPDQEMAHTQMSPRGSTMSQQEGKQQQPEQRGQQQQQRVENNRASDRQDMLRGTVGYSKSGVRTGSGLVSLFRSRSGSTSNNHTIQPASKYVHTQRQSRRWTQFGSFLPFHPLTRQGTSDGDPAVASNAAGSQDISRK
eukprot:gb/GEZN01020168.1/.p1 GENE.gb/GEZN01020168.1/~~gb/GEZN01020168.1/.p1  ORF type:complete len:203 (+),score=42.11 gb/GEZN01020168.1/:3-611(+)